MHCPDVETWRAWRMGTLPPEQQRELAAHRETCERCRSHTSSGSPTVTDASEASAPSATPVSPRPLMRGSSVGRYVVLEPVGSGGMGVVYAAYDPKLDRKVALKLVRTDVEGRGTGPAWQQRLLEEAQALARISHPHVVSVHDTGGYQDQVFLAMELVEGGTLRDWLKAAPRAWRDTLQVLLQAGRGLAAAHASGLVHRDFKPDNVLMGTDGRVRVTDFGLALREAEPEARGPRRSGVAGTRGYQAPEVLAGAPADARSDQFAFCVSLHEALFGRRPFDEGFGEPLPPPRDVRVPAGVRRALLRGLALESQARHPSMDALLQALEAELGVARTRWLAVAGVALAVLAGGGLFSYVSGREQRACAEAASLEGLWDGARQAEAARAFAALSTPFAADAWTRVKPLLNAYSSAWSSQTRDNCEATRVRAEQPEERYRQRSLCLERRRDELRALGDLFGQADEEVARMAVQSVRTLIPVTQCGPGEAGLLDEEAAAPSALRAQVARARVLRSAGRYAQGAELAREAAERAPPGSALQAEALLWLGTLKGLAGDLREAEKRLHEALLAAERSRQRELVAMAWIQLVNTVGVQQGRVEDGQRHASHAEAVVASLDRPARLEQALSMHVGNLFWRAGKPAEAVRHLRRALELQEQELGSEHVDVALTLHTLSGVLRGQARFAEARDVSQRGLDLRKKLLGPEHPDVAASLHMLGTLAREMDDLPNALALQQQSLSLRERVLGPEHPDVAASANHLAIALTEMGRLEESRPYLQRALAIREKALGPEHAEVGLTLNGLGVLAFLRHQNEDALRFFERSLVIKEKALGKEHPSVAFATCNIGIVLHRLGRQKEAWEWHQRALAVRLKTYGERHDDVAYSLTEMGEVLRALGRLDEAWAHHERALRIYRELGRDHVSSASGPLKGMAEVHLARGQGAEAATLFAQALKLLESVPTSPVDLAETRFALARALMVQGRREEALTGARRARTELEATGEAGQHSLGEVRQWLTRHEPRAATAGRRP
ncbi:serine/threonine-protein kinase [Pyxidicoccus xibeiensis]|uniref:serine/threonine-protein kinase n=1 Tax=Pyxidicoccus xibeiensis TaxID=2906759 RepID=UPI0020A71131|nr:serine/threonine-protein kinase [Pyxidicoccus xibeiensis]MCP3138258.1 serine/threonine-protein kinase [Pyxidicoccus xibeiensis]